MSSLIVSRRKLARFGAPTRLGPGERIIGGRVFYSAAWLGPVPLQRPAPGTGKRGSDAVER